MRTTTLLLFALAVAGIALTNCKKNHDDDMPPVNTVTARLTNTDGKDIHFASSSGNTASFSAGDKALFLNFQDSKNQIYITINVNGIEAGEKGNYALDGDSINVAYVDMLSNPSGPQGFCTCTDTNGDFTPDGSGTLTIKSFTSAQVTGILKEATLLSDNHAIPAVTIHDCKFNLKIQ